MTTYKLISADSHVAEPTDLWVEREMTPAWWGRSLHYYHTALHEPIGVVLAMQATQEGQQPALNSEVVLPALARHYGCTSTTTRSTRARSRWRNRRACSAGPRSPISIAATTLRRKTSGREDPLRGGFGGEGAGRLDA